MKHINSVSTLIEALGGNAALARKLNLKHASNVSEWKRRGAIPAWQWKKILDLCKADQDLLHVTADMLVIFHTPDAA